MTNRYETVFIMTPVLSDEQMKETVQKHKKFMEDAGVKIFHEESWGLRKLAYPIQKKSTGFYYLIEFEPENSQVIKDMELNLKRDERIIRFLTVRMDKHAVIFNENKRAKKKKQAAQNQANA
ncbi:MAG: 30S ribosomal protein S6 [Bacteroidales bacterium]|nr:30S ribosomal protein S6 [Bacteroidales bacterium]MCF8326789.1 30S ribosomal protein S6 [Bacteroidales bacterium]